jgi:cob(I)alamin adenosyltransferase
MALYTGKGDSGTTKTFDSKPGERMSKNSQRSEALGSLDELNSFLGWCKVRSAKEREDRGVKTGRKTERIAAIIRRVQEDLFIVQAEVAGAKKKIVRRKVEWEENVIAAIEAEIPPITSFTVVGGASDVPEELQDRAELSALLDVARTIARRVERRCVAVHETRSPRLGKHTLAYLNRLSSLLFALARLINYQSGVKEEAPSYR